MKLKILENSQNGPENWYKEGLSFGCTQCGNCCTGGPGYVWISEVEIGRLAEHLGLSVGDVRKRHLRKIGGKYSLKENRTESGLYDCAFLEQVPRTLSDGSVVNKRICGIYDVRPLQCRTWPFWDGLLEDQKAWEAAKKKCPGMDRGKHYTHEQIEALRQAEDWPKVSPGSR